LHPDGYDVWAAPELFASAGVGAPPDGFFSGGQSWGFPPLHPERIRENRYRYVIASIRTAMRYAAAIRIDHVPGLHRLYWIPEGGDASTGGYVRYRDDELRAIIAIEAFRSGTAVIGEDLGTVSPEIRQAMDADGMLHSFVYQFAATPEHPLPQPTKPSAASVGSHDLPRFATFWRGGDIGELRDRGDIDGREAETRWQIRRSITDAVRSAAPVVVGSDADVRAAWCDVCSRSRSGRQHTCSSISPTSSSKPFPTTGPAPRSSRATGDIASAGHLPTSRPTPR